MRGLRGACRVRGARVGGELGARGATSVIEHMPMIKRTVLLHGLGREQARREDAADQVGQDGVGAAHAQRTTEVAGGGRLREGRHLLVERRFLDGPLGRASHRQEAGRGGGRERRACPRRERGTHHARRSHRRSPRWCFGGEGGKTTYTKTRRISSFLFCKKLNNRKPSRGSPVSVCPDAVYLAVLVRIGSGQALSGARCSPAKEVREAGRGAAGSPCAAY